MIIVITIMFRVECVCVCFILNVPTDSSYVRSTSKRKIESFGFV